MRRKAGTLFIILGVVLLCGALFLSLHNRSEDRQAEQFTADVVPVLIEEILADAQEPSQPEPSREQPRLDPETLTLEMSETVIDGYAYIGILSIPKLSLELPIMSDWSYKQLQISPCRFHGTLNGGNLVLMAHNYRSHFGKLSELSIGDAVVFTDVDGFVTEYTVVARDILQPDAVEELTSGDFDLTLFTCTYGGKTRVTVYCDKA